MPSPYDILDLSRNCTRDDLETAYRKKVKESHPDLGGTTEEFKVVRQAYHQVTEDFDSKENSDTISGRDSSHKEKKSSTADSTTSTNKLYPVTIEYIDYLLIQRNGWNINKSVFDKVSQLDVDEESHGRFSVHRNETVLEAAERSGYTWPFSCRGGACANCAVKIVQGDVLTERYQILSEEMLESGIRLSCVGEPLTSSVKLIYNIRHMDSLQYLLLPERK